VGNAQLSQQVSVLQAQVMGEKRIMAAFEEFKKHKDERVNARWALGLAQNTSGRAKHHERTELVTADVKEENKSGHANK
ncbi:hypothetical protein Tco_1059108, partial [Tanacetum coccineum]